MEIKDFIEKFAEAIEIDNVESLTPETNFRELAEWNSLAGLAVISMFDDEFDKQLSIPEFKSSMTIADLYKLVI